MNSTVEGATALEESWYVTPPACFTRAGPVNVETSPLEDLLIEHPSMSVYRATASPVAPETPPPTPDASEDVVEEDVLPDLVSSAPDTAAAASPERSPRRSEDERQATRRRPAIHDGRPAVDRARTEKRIAQLRSASQKVSDFSFIFNLHDFVNQTVNHLAEREDTVMKYVTLSPPLSQLEYLSACS